MKCSKKLEFNKNYSSEWIQEDFKLPLASGDIIKYVALAPPALSPNTVTLKNAIELNILSLMRVV